MISFNINAEERYRYTIIGGEDNIKRIQTTNGKFKAIINVARGGLVSGNDYANIEAYFDNEEDMKFMIGATSIYYCEYGSNPIKRYKGTIFNWSAENRFNVVEYND